MTVKLSPYHFYKYIESLDSHEEVWYETCSKFDGELIEFDKEFVEEAGDILTDLDFPIHMLRQDTDEIVYILDIPYDEYGMEFLRDWTEMLEEEAREGCLMRG